MSQEYEITSGDFLAGGGGVTEAMSKTEGMKVKWVLNHNKIAIRTNIFNHHGVKHYWSDIYKQDEHEMEPVDFVWASIECFTADTLILTKRGNVPISEVTINDYVLTHKNRWRKVINIFSKESKTVIIKGQGLIRTETTSEHPFYCNTFKNVWDNPNRTYRRRLQHPEWKKLSELSSDALFASPIHFEHCELTNVGGRGFEFSNNFWWMIGRWLGDGSITPWGNTKTITISCGGHKQEDLEKRLNVFLPIGRKPGNSEIKFYKREIRTAYLFEARHTGLYDWLENNFGKYAYGKTIPGWVLGMNIEWRKSLLDGYISSDGYNNRKKGIIECSTVSKKLAIGLKLLAQSLGYNANIYNIKARNNPIEGRQVNCREQYKILWAVYPKQVEHLKDVDHVWTKLREMTETNEIKQVFNLHIEEDESYIANGIVVHNCTQHSLAKGGGEKNIGSYMLGWELVRYIKHLSPFVIGIENVPEFKKWSPLGKDGQPDKKKIGQEFEKWKNTICALGYDYHESIRNAADDGIPTRRIRYFAFFTRKELGMKVNWPMPTHSKTGINGLEKWVACKDYIDLKNEGNSIFGRKFNPNVRKNQRHELSPNTLRRIAGGIKKFVPEMYEVMNLFSEHFIMHYYSQGTTSQSINDPLHTISTKDRHLLIKIEKMQFVQDYCRQDIYDKIEDPLSPQLTWQTKHLVTIEKKFLADYHGRDDTAHDLNGPANTITCENSKHLVSTSFISKHFSGKGHNAESLDGPLPTVTTIDHNSIVTANFISKQYNSNGEPGANNYSVNDPLGALTTEEKNQFITAHFNSGGNPESQNQDIGSPLGSVTTGNNKSLITAFQEGLIDFDIKMRFLDPGELSDISTFPKGYFTHPMLKLTRKEQTWLIGNAVPPEWAKKIIAPVVDELRGILMARKVAI